MDVEVIGGRVVLVNDELRPPREVAYKCLDCSKKWLRFTDERVLSPEPCPYCGGNSRLSSDTGYNPP